MCFKAKTFPTFHFLFTIKYFYIKAAVLITESMKLKSWFCSPVTQTLQPRPKYQLLLPRALQPLFPLSPSLVLELKIVFDGRCLQGPKPVFLKAKVNPAFPALALPGSAVVVVHVFVRGVLVFLGVSLPVGRRGAFIWTVVLHEHLPSLRQHVCCRSGF